jgi:hypothetical protein
VKSQPVPAATRVESEGRRVVCEEEEEEELEEEGRAPTSLA